MPTRPNAEEELRITEAVEGGHALVLANDVLEDGSRFSSSARTHSGEVRDGKDAHDVTDANLGSGGIPMAPGWPSHAISPSPPNSGGVKRRAASAA